MKWNGSPFMSMEWEFNPIKLIIGDPRYASVFFDEYEDEKTGRKKQVVSGCYPDQNRTKFNFYRWDNFIQPNEIVKEYMKIYESKRTSRTN